MVRMAGLMEMMTDDANGMLDQDGMNVTDATDRLYGGGMNAYHIGGYIRMTWIVRTIDLIA